MKFEFSKQDKYEARTGGLGRTYIPRKWKERLFGLKSNKIKTMNADKETYIEKYEYKIERIKQVMDYERIKYLNQMGDLGWSLVWVDEKFSSESTYYFKREKHPQP